jgi:hypothetical protein
MVCDNKDRCDVIKCLFVLLVLISILYAIYALEALRATVIETQLTLHTALTMAQERQKTDQSVCCSNTIPENSDMCSMVDVATAILDRFPRDKIAYSLVRFMSFLYGFTIT